MTAIDESYRSPRCQSWTPFPQVSRWPPEKSSLPHRQTHLRSGSPGPGYPFPPRVGDSLVSRPTQRQKTPLGISDYSLYLSRYGERPRHDLKKPMQLYAQAGLDRAPEDSTLLVSRQCHCSNFYPCQAEKGKTRAQIKSNEKEKKTPIKREYGV